MLILAKIKNLNLFKADSKVIRLERITRHGREKKVECQESLDQCLAPKSGVEVRFRHDKFIYLLIREHMV